MPRQRALHKYSEEYYDLCKKAHTETVHIAFSSRQKARNFRIEMYQFRQALRKALLNNPDSESLQLAVLFAEGLEFIIKDSNLLIRQKKSKASKIIAEVLCNPNSLK